MVTAQITKIKNGKIVLPGSIQKSWENSNIYVNISDDTILLKRFNVPKVSDSVFDSVTSKKLKLLGTRVSTRYIRTAVRAARKAK